MKKIPFREAIGSLMHLAIHTRPDLLPAVSFCSRFMSKAQAGHSSAVKRIFRYLNGTAKLGLTLGKLAPDLTVIGYSDADNAGDLSYRKSTTGYVFQMCGSTISFSCKKQATVALSTTEAEYIALAATVQQAIWIRELLNSLNLKLPQSIIIFEDNQATIQSTKHSTTTPN